MRVDLVDPPAYSVPYDHALAAALAGRGLDVRLVTSRFAYGPVSPADGFTVDERFYRLALGSAGSALRRAAKLAEHVPDMIAYRRAAARQADVVHFQWLPVPAVDLRLLPDRPVVLTVHDPLQRRSRPRMPGRLRADAFGQVDAVVVHSDYARAAVIAAHGLNADKVHVIRHGALGQAQSVAGQRAGDGVARPLPPELADTEVPVVLSFGLLRPYKGLETLLRAWRGVDGAQLWVVGRPMMDVAGLEASAPAGVRILPRFVSDDEQAALFERADVIVLPYERGERFGFSGVLATALGYGKAIVLSDVGGLAEVASLGAARSVTPGDPEDLRRVLTELIGDPVARDELGSVAHALAADEFSWQSAARETVALYEKILA